MIKINFYGGEGKRFKNVNYLISEDGRVYAECNIQNNITEEDAEDYGYLTMKNAIIDELETKGLDVEIEFPCNDELLDENASVDCDVFVEIK